MSRLTARRMALAQGILEVLEVVLVEGQHLHVGDLAILRLLVLPPIRYTIIELCQLPHEVLDRLPFADLVDGWGEVALQAAGSLLHLPLSLLM